MQPTGPVVAVGGIVVHEGALLMVQRGREPGLGLWSIPGGTLEPHELLADAVAREVKEETGVDVEVGALAGIFEVPGTPHYVILDHLAEVAGDPTPTAGDDAADARWVPLHEVATLPCTPRLVETMTAWGVLQEPS